MGLPDIYNKLSDQEKKIFYVALGFISLMVFDLLFLQPATNKIKNLDHDIAQAKSDIKRDVRFLSYQQKIVKEDELYKFYQPDDKKSEEEVIAAFLKTIENLGREAEVVVGKLNPGEAVPKKGYIHYFANVECNGKLENIIKFVHKIDTTTNLLKVVKMNVIAKKTSADEVTVSMKICKLIIDVKASGAEEKAAQDAAIKEMSPTVAGQGVSAAGGAISQSQGSPRAQTAGGVRGETGGGSGSGAGAVDKNVSGGAGGGSRGGAGSGGADSGGGTGGDLGTGGSGGADGSSEGGASGGGGGGAVSGRGSGGGSGAGENSKGEGSGVKESGGGSGAAGGSGSGGGEVGKPDDMSDSGGGDGAGAAGDDGGDIADANGGATGTQGSTTKNKKAKDLKSKEIKNTQQPQSKTEPEKPAPLEVNKNNRMKVTGIEELWNNFWGIKPKERKPADPRVLNKDDYKSKDELKPNVWERVLHK
jgi:hypothetical protein